MLMRCRGLVARACPAGSTASLAYQGRECDEREMSPCHVFNVPSPSLMSSRSAPPLHRYYDEGCKHSDSCVGAGMLKLELPAPSDITCAIGGMCADGYNHAPTTASIGFNPLPINANIVKIRRQLPRRLVRNPASAAKILIPVIFSPCNKSNVGCAEHKKFLIDARSNKWPLTPAFIRWCEFVLVAYRTHGVEDGPLLCGYRTLGVEECAWQLTGKSLSVCSRKDSADRGTSQCKSPRYNPESDGKKSDTGDFHSLCFKSFVKWFFFQSYQKARWQRSVAAQRRQWLPRWSFAVVWRT